MMVVVSSFQPTSCFGVHVDGEEVVAAVMCGIPALSTATKLALSVWNWKNFLTQPASSNSSSPGNGNAGGLGLGLQLWQAAATFSGVTIPAPSSSHCRYGDPFRGGGNPIVRYEAGLGTQNGLADVAEYREVGAGGRGGGSGREGGVREGGGATPSCATRRESAPRTDWWTWRSSER